MEAIMAAKEISVKKYVVRLSREERQQLETLIRKGKGPARRLLKARILLKADVSDAGEGWSDNEIIRTLDTSASMVYRVRKQLVEEGFAAVLSRKQRATPAVQRIFDGEKEAKLIALTCSNPTHDFKRHGIRTFIRRRPSLQMVSTTPPSIELSPIQRDMLDLIIQDQAAVQRAAEPERAILLWSQGVSETQTGHKLRITKKDVQLIRKRWWNARPRVTAAEKGLHTAFRSLVNLIFRIPSEKAPSEHPLSEGMTADRSRANVVEATEIRPAARALIEILHHKPTNYGINRSNWSYGSLAEAYGNVYGRRPSKGTVGRLLRGAGLRWKKSRRVLTSPDPNYREKVELLLKTLHSLKVDEDLFFIDELGPLQVKRYGGRSYVSQGQTPTHPQAQRSKGSITLYAALSAKTNQVAWFYGKSKDSAGTIDLAEIIFNRNLSKSRIYLTWDAASWHRSSQLVQWVDNFNEINAVGGPGPRIEFVPLPSSAQFLNVVEAIFSGMKRAVIHGSDYQSDKEMKMAISKHLCDRNQFFLKNPKRAGNKIWDIDFFQDYNRIRSGNYRKW
jgi:transposase